MSEWRARAMAHIRALHPRLPFWPAAPFWLLALFWGVQGKLRWDHVVVALLATFMSYWSEWTKRLYLGILPIGLVGVLYDTMRAVKNVGLTRDNVHVCDVRAIDQRFFGITINGVRSTLHDYFQAHATPFLDVYCAIPYGIFIGVVIAYSVYLFRRDYPGLLRFTWSFLALNVAGFITYHLYPAAPPWYFHHYGCAVDLATHASEGPNLARVDAWLGVPYFAGVYGRSSDVFGAVPSLPRRVPVAHVARGLSAPPLAGPCALGLVLFVDVFCGRVPRSPLGVRYRARLGVHRGDLYADATRIPNAPSLRIAWRAGSRGR